jgi:hypothetical protein
MSVSFGQSFTTKRTKDTISEIDLFEFLNFVLFVGFVVQCLFRFLLAACRTRFFAVKLNLPARHKFFPRRVLPAHVLRDRYVGGAKGAIGFGIRSGWIDAVL